MEICRSKARCIAQLGCNLCWSQPVRWCQAALPTQRLFREIQESEPPQKVPTACDVAHAVTISSQARDATRAPSRPPFTLRSVSKHFFTNMPGES
jgi:hypothetical protein